MRIGSVLENQNLEKRISITPEIVKKYTSLGFEISLCENYGSHLGIKDEHYKQLGVTISKDENEKIIVHSLENKSLLTIQMAILCTQNKFEFWLSPFGQGSAIFNKSEV